MHPPERGQRHGGSARTGDAALDASPLFRAVQSRGTSGWGGRRRARGTLQPAGGSLVARARGGRGRASHAPVLPTAHRVRRAGDVRIVHDRRGRGEPDWGVGGSRAGVSGICDGRTPSARPSPRVLRVGPGARFPRQDCERHGARSGCAPACGQRRPAANGRRCATPGDRARPSGRSRTFPRGRDGRDDRDGRDRPAPTACRTLRNGGSVVPRGCGMGRACDPVRCTPRICRGHRAWGLGHSGCP